jgi:menaquinone-specific isochorismate synthase
VNPSIVPAPDRRHEPAGDDPALAAALAAARRGAGLTFIALHAPVVAAPVLVDAWRDAPVVSWTASATDAAALHTIVGIGVARELRGVGASRWSDVVERARALAIAGAIVATDLGSATRLGPLDTLGLARPRFLGGAAFAPGAADRAPWLGFGDAWFALPRWTYVHDGVRAWLVLAIDDTEASDPARWQAELAIHRVAFEARPIVPAQPAMIELGHASAEQWRTQVESITTAIEREVCSKVVAARTCSVALAGPVRAAELLAALDERHTDCVRVLVRPPGGGTLVAASPERLVQRAGSVVLCDALAGTVRHDGSDDREAAAALLASAKDRREHDLVVRAIRTALEGTGAVVEAPDEPIVRVLRHVLHLHTPFRATSETPPHVLELAARLHPTPAVGGTPTDVAVEWIRSHEPVSRGWYASPVGWFDLDGNGELAVAIRSGVLVGNRAHLWAGAGIVAGSDPDRELAETELKLRAMLGALGATDAVTAVGWRAGAAGHEPAGHDVVGRSSPGRGADR